MRYKLLSCMLIISAIVCCAMLTPSCKKLDTAVDTGSVSYSVDTLLFDTVFTNQGSSTRSVMLYNKGNERIRIQSLRLKNGDRSFFNLNLNGKAAKSFENVEIAANDSVWVFATVFIDPNNQNNPFIVDDALIATINGKEFTLPVLAFGQNVHYLVDSVIKTTTFQTNKPYVLVGNIFVDEGETLTIPAGSRIYMHANARIFVLGTLKILGNSTDSVVFRGDRLDRDIYVGSDDGIPGEWGGIYFNKTSYNNEIHYTNFVNGGAATRLGDAYTLPATIQVNQDTVKNGTPQLYMTHSQIRNSMGYGIIAFDASIKAENCLIAECSETNVALLQGGQYEFTYSTIVTYGNRYLDHSKGIAAVAMNYYITNPASKTYIAANLQAKFNNCIIYGSNKNEIHASSVVDAASVITLNHCLTKRDDNFETQVEEINTLNNQSPEFVNYSQWDYQLKPESPVIGKGIHWPSITIDILGKSRANPPSMGCFEYAP